ncbi:MAG: hypothetical protein JWR80_2907 [Bradyrhizobium sp.]|nr:hypothetical protein [Bradyrhizobium sp.]
MDAPSAKEIAAHLTPRQRLIVLATPQSWNEADALPDGLFEYDETYHSGTAQESGFWSPTDLGKQVHAILDAEDS